MNWKRQPRPPSMHGSMGAEEQLFYYSKIKYYMSYVIHSMVHPHKQTVIKTECVFITSLVA